MTDPQSPTPPDRLILEEIHPPLLVGALLLKGVVLAAVHLRYGPPVTFIAAVLLTILTPVLAYGTQKSLERLPHALRVVRAALGGAVQVYSTQHRSVHSGSASPAAAPDDRHRSAAEADTTGERR